MASTPALLLAAICSGVMYMVISKKCASGCCALIRNPAAPEDCLLYSFIALQQCEFYSVIKDSQGLFLRRSINDRERFVFSVLAVDCGPLGARGNPVETAWRLSCDPAFR